MAAIFVALYALCIMLPTVALALEGQCLMEGNGKGAHQHVAAAAHDHQHGDSGHAHQRADGVKQALHDPDAQGGNDDGAAGKCCAVMFLSAITPELGIAPVPAKLTSPTFVGITQSFSGIPPGKLIRPPKLQS